MAQDERMDLVPAVVGQDVLPLAGGIARTASQLCTPGLWRLLTDGDDWGAVARIVALNAALRTELRTVAPALAQRAAPADQLDLMARLIEMAPTFGITNRSDGEWAALFGTYLDALAGIPLEAIDEAIMRWNRGEMYPEPKDKGRHAFFPKPVEIYTLAQPRRLELSKVAYRARKALEAPRVEARDRPEPTAEDRAKVAAMARDLAAKLGGRGADPQRPAEPRHVVADRMRTAARPGPDDVDEAV